MKNIIEIAQLVKVCEKIDGRVKLQKIVHILQENGQPFREMFGYLHHGPYSNDLKREIDQLVDWGIVSEEETQVGSYMRYSYAPCDKIDDVLAEVGVSSEPDWIELARTLNRKQSRELEAISTIMFLRRRGFAKNRLQQRFVRLKPHLEDRFSACLEEVESLQRLPATS